MGTVVVRGVRNATDALLAGDDSLGADVVSADAFIDASYASVEMDVFDVVALEAPVARDLRFVIATFRIAANIERCGDLVASIARRAGRIDPEAMSPAVRDIVRRMGDAAEATFDRAMQAYAVIDPDVAAGVAGLDLHVDALQRDLLRALVAEQVDAESVIDLSMVARFFERVGDHAVVIAERVRFVAVGEMDAGDRDDT